jgi:hypothetical protein
MKKLLYIALWLPVIASCNMKDPESNMGNIHVMEDTLFKTYPTVNRLTVEVKEFSEVVVTLGDKELFNAPDEKRQQVAEEIGKISVHLFEENNYLEKGKVIYTDNETTLDASHNKESDMHLEKYLKGGGK